jgi:methyltransferase
VRPAALILALVTLQRLGELVLAHRNTRALLKRGAFEVGATHYPFIVAMHVAWLAALWAFGWNQPVNLFALIGFVVLQGFRVWVLSTLRVRWTTRIIILPGEPRITWGPYRYVSHPNYAIVVAEIALLPLALQLPMLALVFTVLNAAMLVIRVRAEARALATARLDRQRTVP